MSPNNNQQDLRNHLVVRVLFVICFFGVLASIIWFLNSGANYQERFNLEFAANSNLSALTQGSPDNPMPLYYALLHQYAKIIQPSITTLRALSLASYVLAVLALYAAAVIATRDKRIGILAAVLLGVSPFMLWYANRGAVYAPLVLVSILSHVGFTLILRHRHLGWPLYLAATAIGLWTHYFFVTILVLQIMFFVLKWRDFKWAERFAMISSSCLLLTGFTVWMNHLAHTIHVLDILPYTGKPSATNTFIIYVQYLFGFQSVTTTTFIIAFWPLLVILALLAIQKYVKPPVGVQYFSFTALFLVLGVFALGWAWRSLFLSSYLIIGLPSFILAISWYLVAFELNVLAATRLILIATMLLMLYIQSLNIPRAIREDYLGDVPYPGVTANTLSPSGGGGKQQAQLER